MLIYAQKGNGAWLCSATTSDWDTTSWDGPNQLDYSPMFRTICLNCFNHLNRLCLLQCSTSILAIQNSEHSEDFWRVTKLQQSLCASQTQTLRGNSSASHYITKQSPTWSSIWPATPIHHECFPKIHHPRTDRQPTRSTVIPFAKPLRKPHLEHKRK